MNLEFLNELNLNPFGNKHIFLTYLLIKIYTIIYEKNLRMLINHLFDVQGKTVRKKKVFFFLSESF